jgi:hypothetical protein
MTVTSRTGAGLPDLFADARDDDERRVADWLLAPLRPFAGAMMASATVAMHVREGIAVSGLSAGMVTAGTASGDEHWAGRLAAPRGCLRLLDSGRVEDDGVRRPLWPHEPAEPWQERLFQSFVVTERAALEERALLFVAASPFALAPDAPADPAPASELARVARAMTDVPAAVAVERPLVPELTDQPAENVRRLFALTVAQLADLFGVTERQMHRYLREGLPENRRALADALTAVGLTVIGGLGARGAQRWLYTGEPTAAEMAEQGRIAELSARAEALRDSPVT